MFGSSSRLPSVLRRLGRLSPQTPFVSSVGMYVVSWRFSLSQLPHLGGPIPERGDERPFLYNK